MYIFQSIIILSIQSIVILRKSVCTEFVNGIIIRYVL